MTMENPYVIKAFGAYLLGDSVWLSMEYCVGSILDILKLSGGSLGEQEIAPICESVLRGWETSKMNFSRSNPRSDLRLILILFHSSYYSRMLSKRTRIHSLPGKDPQRYQGNQHPDQRQGRNQALRFRRVFDQLECRHLYRLSLLDVTRGSSFPSSSPAFF